MLRVPTTSSHRASAQDCDFFQYILMAQSVGGAQSVVSLFKSSLKSQLQVQAFPQTLQDGLFSEAWHYNKVFASA